MHICILTSQSDRPVEVGRHLWRVSGALPLLEQGAAQQLPAGCGHLRGWRLPSRPGQRVPTSSHPQEKVFPYVQVEFPVLVADPFPVTGYHWEEPSATFFPPSQQVFKDMDAIHPQAFSSPV